MHCAIYLFIWFIITHPIQSKVFIESVLKTKGTPKAVIFIFHKRIAFYIKGQILSGSCSWPDSISNNNTGWGGIRAEYFSLRFDDREHLLIIVNFYEWAAVSSGSSWQIKWTISIIILKIIIVINIHAIQVTM